MIGLLALLLFALLPAVRGVDLAYEPAQKKPLGGQHALLLQYAPVFVARESEDQVNRIGTPEIRSGRGRDRVWVNPAAPAIYSEVRRDQIAETPVLQLLYRVHFRAVPLASKVFFEAHQNAGVLAIVTLTERDRRPLFFTTVHTCGCFLALLPTDHLPREALPKNWPRAIKRVTGKRLPAIVEHPEPGRTRLVLWLEPKTHRVEHIETQATPPNVSRATVRLHRMDELHRLPVRGGNGRHASFFHTSGPLRGYVRGAWSPIEGLTAGLLLLDPMLGSDKDFGDPGVTGTKFYTSLWPWERDISRLDRMGVLLKKSRFDLTTLAER
jgi:hypothetical protein